MTENKRESFSNRWGFIMACIGSAVGMGNIWLFPTRVSLYGGGSFILPYIICVVLLGYSGVMGEIGLGRSTRSGAVGAFGKAMKHAGKNEKTGQLLGYVPTIAGFLLAIGYTVVVGWIFKYMVGAFTGATLAPGSVDEFGAAFGGMASNFGNTPWQIVAALLCFGIMVAGIANGIEVANKILMPLFYLLFIGLAVYVSQQPGASEGYKYIFTINPEFFFSPLVWIYALGQAFFSLSLGGTGTVIYGSYLDDREDIPSSAVTIAFFDSLAAIIASLVIIPAIATTGSQLDAGGPGLMFIHLPNLFKNMPGGGIVTIVFFVAVLFAAVTSIINLYEMPIATLQDIFGFSRKKAAAVIALIGITVSVMIQGITGEWMDFVSIYLNPLGAILAAIMFFWVFGSDYVREELQKGRKTKIGPWLEPMTKYVFVGITILVYVAGILLGGIG